MMIIILTIIATTNVTIMIMIIIVIIKRYLHCIAVVGQSESELQEVKQEDKT